jgi:uncharacterized protein YjiS (DUF1127 family)
MTYQHSTNAPAFPGIGTIAWLFKLPARLFWSLRDRQALAGSMSTLSERELRDIGLTRADIHSALHTADSRDASDRLYRTALQQSRNW